MLYHSSTEQNFHLVKQARNIYLSTIRLQTAQNQLPSKTKIVRHSMQNCNRIHNLNKKLKQTKQKFYQQIQNIRNKQNQVCQMELFQKIHVGPFSTVFKVRIISSGKHYALKKIIIDETHQSRQQTICRNIHSNFLVKIIDVYTDTVNNQPKLNILMELYNWNLKQYIQADQPIDPITYKILCYQMCRSLVYLHSKSICHRDIKPDNFLMNKTGRIVLSDFGAAKMIKPNQQSLSYISSRPYRAPQLLLGVTKYTTAVDIWALGCVFVEMLTKKSMFNGSSSMDCLLNMGRILGSKDLKKIKTVQHDFRNLPYIKGFGLNEYLDKKASPLLIDLLSKMLKICSSQRIKAIDLLIHPYFDQLRDDQAYQQIMKEKVDISDFFDFNPSEIKNYEHYRTKLIPAWKRIRPHKPTSND